jgi:predicted DNA-binding protein
MVVELPTAYEHRLRAIADREGRPVSLLVEEAVRNFLEAEAITDLEPSAVGDTQMALARELRDVPEWEEGRD